MKSYKEHLLSTKSFGENTSKTLQKPVYKTSAIFPVIESEALHTKILFMGYWLLKRNIPQLGFLISLRSEDGKLILRKNSSIDSAKAFEVSIKDLINELDYNIESFIGSIELEIFSIIDLVFPYPAFVIDYYNKMGAGLVHTTGRIYNDIEDLQANESIKVDEAGFDILPSKEYEPFFAFVNGHINSKNTDITIELIKESGEIFSKDINLGEVSPLQTVFFKLKNFLDVDAFLQDEIGTAKIKHNLTGFFPRFIAGNFSRVDNAVSITHTYYDNSENKNSSDYFENENPKILLDSSIFVPLFLEDNWYTQVKLYPIYTPSNHSINLKFFDEKREIYWYPSVVNMGPKGIIFPEGNVEYWVWKYAEVVEVPKEEQKNYPVLDKDGEFYTEKLDVENAQTFGQYEFLEACKCMGIVGNNLTSKGMERPIA